MTVQVTRTKDYVAQDVAELEFPDGLDRGLVRAEVEQRLAAGELDKDFVGQGDPEYVCSGYSLTLGEEELHLEYED